MRAVVQRVTSAACDIADRRTGEIGKGYMVLLCVMEGDTQKDIEYMVQKLTGLRVFEDEQGKMNLSITDVGGSMLIISQFTLAGDARKGRRPSFIASAAPDIGSKMYDEVYDIISKSGINVQKGEFGADMKISLVNDGPVTILLDSSRLF